MNEYLTGGDESMEILGYTYVMSLVNELHTEHQMHYYYYHTLEALKWNWVNECRTGGEFDGRISHWM